MYKFRYCLTMWVSFAILFNLSVLGLEILEGNKITTTEYYGLQNIGIIFIGMIFLTTSFLYPVTLLPLTWLIRKWVKSPTIRIAFYTLLGGLCGMFIFRFLYDDYFVRGYDLQISTSIVIFSFFGLVYALIDQFSPLKAADK
ncbi:hypothetical protein [Cohnella herbarum]|uniref:Uncharacterized protein n=1 Tax=Cohnella herbarum TaxID=2728023 RepID=A0A7Z2ZJM2_9BACL|nr:hypothetical protein [Cohnella herbarum]QJD81950.1 hypothetical protein HH215_01300 [Cohnella herbarum]